MKKELLSLLLVLGFHLLSAQSPIGLWENVDDSTGELQSYIQIYESNGKLHGKVLELTPGAYVTHCNACDGQDKGASLVGMHILKDLEPQGDSWDYGTILDPKKGKHYKCKISLEDNNTLKVRGYIGRPLFGKTFKWVRAPKAVFSRLSTTAAF
jgi:uncharacterized protein (DUF2147 family)